MAVEDAPVMDYRFASGRLTLSGHLAVPTTGIAGAPGLVLLHGFPTRGRESEQSGKSFPELAERIAAELGWVVLTVNFRGCGAAEGDFSLVGWLDDVHAAVGHLSSLGVSGVWLSGFGTGGSLAVCEGARNRKVRGVAALATPGDFEDWSRQPRQLLLHARNVHVVKDPDFPPDFDAWAAELKMVQPVPDAARIAPRPFLVVHGDRDDLTPLDDGRALAASHGDAEIRIIDGAGHELRHDPRAVAVFLGWLARQQASEVERLTAEEMAVELAVELADELSADSVDLDGADDE